MSYQFYVPVRTLFGTGKLNELHMQAMPGKKAMAAMATNKGDIWDYMNGEPAAV